MAGDIKRREVSSRRGPKDKKNNLNLILAAGGLTGVLAFLASERARNDAFVAVSLNADAPAEAEKIPTSNRTSGAEPIPEADGSSPATDGQPTQIPIDWQDSEGNPAQKKITPSGGNIASDGPPPQNIPDELYANVVNSSPTLLLKLTAERVAADRRVFEQYFSSALISTNNRFSSISVEDAALMIQQLFYEGMSNSLVQQHMQRHGTADSKIDDYLKKLPDSERQALQLATAVAAVR